MAVEMELSRIFIRELTDAQVIELREVDGVRTFPIVVGLPEAYAIERRLKGIEPPRPQTHDLLASVVQHLDGEVTHIVIDDLREGTFYAKLHVRQGEAVYKIDARPSDAIALGVAQGVPIYVEEHVLLEVEADESLGGDEDLEGGGATEQFDWD